MNLLKEAKDLSTLLLSSLGIDKLYLKETRKMIEPSFSDDELESSQIFDSSHQKMDIMIQTLFLRSGICLKGALHLSLFA